MRQPSGLSAGRTAPVVKSPKPQTQVRVDLPAQTVTNLATGPSEHFDINGYKKYCLMNGLDDIDFLLESLQQHSLPPSPAA